MSLRKFDHEQRFKQIYNAYKKELDKMEENYINKCNLAYDNYINKCNIAYDNYMNKCNLVHKKYNRMSALFILFGVFLLTVIWVVVTFML